MHTDENYELFWARILKLRDEFAVDEPTMPQKRKMSARYEDGITPSDFPSCPKTHHRQIYYETLDLISSFILQRFDQSGFRTYHVLQDLILNAAKGASHEEELQTVTSFYKDDFHEASLKVQLELFTTGFAKNEQSTQPTLCEVLKYVKSISTAMECGMSEVMKLINLILIMPATNAVSGVYLLCEE